MEITKTAFYQYLSFLTLNERKTHLRECGANHGDLYLKLAEYFKEAHPYKIAHLIEEQLTQSPKK